MFQLYNLAEGDCNSFKVSKFGKGLSGLRWLLAIILEAKRIIFANIIPFSNSKATDFGISTLPSTVL